LKMLSLILFSILSIVAAINLRERSVAGNTNTSSYLAWALSDSITAQWCAAICDRYSGTMLVASDLKFNVWTSHNFGLNFSDQVSAPDLGFYAYTTDGTGQYIAAGTQTSGVYISTNYGVSWKLTGAPTVGDYYALGSSIISGASNWTIVAVGLYSGVYISTDTGNTWTSISPITHTTGASYGSGLGFSNTAQVLQVTYTDPTKGTSLYYSTNYGSTWTASSGVPSGIGMIASSKSTGQFLVAGGSGVIYLSSNYGMTWVSATVPVADLDYTYPVMSGSGQYCAIIGGGQKIFFSNDFGQTWTLTNAPVANYVQISTNLAGDHWVTASNSGKVIVGKIIRK